MRRLGRIPHFKKVLWDGNGPIKFPWVKCTNCGHGWRPRVERINRCSKCGRSLAKHPPIVSERVAELG